MSNPKSILSWTLISECPIPEDVKELLVEGEAAIAAYKTLRDSAIFTNKRLIIRDAQGSYREKGGDLFFALFGHKYVVDGKCREITGFKCGSRIVDASGAY